MAKKIKLQWRCSYETLKYDTLDGDLDFNQYAEHPNGKSYIIRTKEKKEWNTKKINKENFDIIKLQKVNIVIGELMVYDEFFLPNGKIIRVMGNKTDYNNRKTIPNYPQPIKELIIN